MMGREPRVIVERLDLQSGGWTPDPDWDAAKGLPGYEPAFTESVTYWRTPEGLVTVRSRASVPPGPDG